MNEEFDEEGVEFDEEVVVVDTVQPAHTHVIGGLRVGFKAPARGQLVALSRVRDSVSRELRRLQQDKSLDEKVRYERASHQVFNVDMAILALVESLIIDESDRSYVANALLVGDTDLIEISDVLFGNSPEPDDDATPVSVVPQKKAPRKVAARKVANAKRTIR
jgi:hypothetical protein